MKYEKIDVSCSGFREGVALYVYLLDYSQEIMIEERPMILICPGGGYAMTSDREAEIIAMQYLSMGYHAAVLRYSVAPAVFPTALCELGKSVCLMREHAKEWHVDPNKVIVSGFSAGGHLAASYSVFWNRGFVGEALGVDSSTLKPNGLILCYPVITSGEFAHHESIQNLLGNAYEEKKEEMSLEKQVSTDVPRTFIWHTYEDNVVPVQNSLMFVDALVKNQISTEFHMFAKGGHGLSVANRLTVNQWNGIEPTCQPWVELVHNWLESWVV